MLFTRKQLNSFFPSIPIEPEKKPEKKHPRQKKTSQKEKNREHAFKYRYKQHCLIKMLETKIRAIRPDFELKPLAKTRAPPTLKGMDKKERNKIHAAAHRKRLFDHITYLESVLTSLER